MGSNKEVETKAKTEVEAEIEKTDENVETETPAEFETPVALDEASEAEAEASENASNASNESTTSESSIDDGKTLAELNESPEVAKPEVETKTQSNALGLDDKQLIADMLIDPGKVISQITEAVLAQVEKKSQTESVRQSTWKSFYAQHEDLAKNQELVSLVYDQMIRDPELAKLPTREGLKKLAERSRKIVKTIRGSEEELEEIDTTKKTPTVSGSKPAGLRKAAQEEAKSLSFSDAVRNFQRTKRS